MTFLIYHTLGRIYYSLGKFDEAEKKLLLALYEHKKVSGLEHACTLHAAKNVRTFYNNRGQFDMAKDISQRFL